jgi:hypothetical protein
MRIVLNVDEIAYKSIAVDGSTHHRRQQRTSADGVAEFCHLFWLAPNLQNPLCEAGVLGVEF